MGKSRILYAAAGGDGSRTVEAALKAALPAGEIILADTLDAVRSALEAGACGLLVSDYALPRFDALALLHERNVLAPEVPAIVVGPKLSCEKCQELLKLGAESFISLEELPRLPRAASSALASGPSRAAAGRAVVESRMDALRLLAGGVAHDFNNILGAIEGYATLNLRTLNEDDPLKADLLEVRKAVAKGSELSRQLLLFSRDYPAQPRPVRLEELEAGVRAALPPGSPAGLEFSVPAGLPPLSGDKAELTQALVNLVLNAADAMPAGGTARINAAADPAGEQIKITVADSGPGIAREALPRIFDPFFTTRPKGKGKGLGLSAVYGIVRRHGGRIEAASSASGAVFTVFLPAFRPGPQPGQAPAASASRSSSPAVLLIEDDADLLAIAARGLGASGYKVLQASTLAGGLEQLRLHAPEIGAVLADIVLPDGRSTEAAGEMVRLAPGASLVFISGHDQSEEVKNLVSGGGFRFLQKPYSIDSLLALVADCFRT